MGEEQGFRNPYQEDEGRKEEAVESSLWKMNDMEGMSILFDIDGCFYLYNGGFIDGKEKEEKEIRCKL